VAYFSRKHSPAEINYDIYERKLLTGIQATRECPALPEGFPHIISIITDYQDLTYLTTNHLLNYR
jgi:hypothetical protein